MNIQLTKAHPIQMTMFISKLMTIFFYLSKDNRRSPDDTNDHSFKFVVKISFISVYLKHSQFTLFPVSFYFHRILLFYVPS